MSTTLKTDPQYGPDRDYINWDSDQTNSYDPTVVSPPWSTVLEGDQCLVFFLGGRVDTINGGMTCTGFAKNEFDPVFPRQSSTEDRWRFYDFDSGRLASISAGRGLNPGPFNVAFPSYLDQDGQQPFLYFSSYRATNGYNRYFMASPPSVTPTYTSGPWSDCHTFGVWPYQQSNLDYQKTETYQIVSAGGDKKFGAGTAKNVSSTAVTSTGSQTVTLAAAPAFQVGQSVEVDTESAPELVKVTAINFTPSPPTYTMTAIFGKTHTANFSVTGPFWSKQTAGDVYVTGSAGADDVSNFSEKPLGTTVANQ
jgi:hypothetical protein